MKQTDIKPCIGCGQGVMHDNAITFFRIRANRMIVDLGAVQRQTGLEMMLGGHAKIANVMGPNDDMAKSFAEYDVLVCMECSFKSLAQLLESAAKKDEATALLAEADRMSMEDEGDG